MHQYFGYSQGIKYYDDIEYDRSNTYTVHYAKFYDDDSFEAYWCECLNENDEPDEYIIEFEYRFSDLNHMELLPKTEYEAESLFKEIVEGLYKDLGRYPGREHRQRRFGEYKRVWNSR